MTDLFPTLLYRTIVTSILRLATLMPLVTSPDATYKLGLASIFMSVSPSLASSLPPSHTLCVQSVLKG
jgi:hypothetical protein